MSCAFSYSINSDPPPPPASYQMLQSKRQIMFLKKICMTSLFFCLFDKCVGGRYANFVIWWLLKWLNDNVIEHVLGMVTARSLSDEFIRKKMPTVVSMSPFFVPALKEKGFDHIRNVIKIKYIILTKFRIED